MLASCTSREPGRQDSKPAPDQREQASEAARGGDPVVSAAAPASEIEVALTERYVDPRFGFELAYPSPWTASEGPGMPALMVASPSEGPGDRFGENVNVVVEPLLAPLTTNEYADGSAVLLQTDLTEYRELSRSVVDLAGQTLVRREYEHTYAGRPLWVVSYMLVVDRRAYVITATAERVRAPSWQRALESIARSFRLT